MHDLRLDLQMHSYVTTRHHLSNFVIIINFVRVFPAKSKQEVYTIIIIKDYKWAEPALHDLDPVKNIET